ncbi:hypothetical protein BH09PSE6_BH09PSE6_11760 [soil metagenome]
MLLNTTDARQRAIGYSRFMPVHPTVSLFGNPWLLTEEGVRVMFTHERPHQLLALLACRREWIQRDELAEWFWPAQAPAAARSNLRKVLLLATRVPGVQLEREGDRLRWAPDSDLLRFEEACDDGRFEAAIALHAAPLLDGMERTLEQSPRDWLEAERQRLKARWRKACEYQLTNRATRPAEAALLAERVLAGDPLDEAAVLALARARLASSQAGQANAALSVYVRQLRDTVGAEPSAAVRALLLQTQMASADAPESAAPAQGHGFIGRKVELAAIRAAMKQPQLRCLTVVGPGGIGKSSVGRTAASMLAGELGRPTAWAPLLDLTEVSQVPARLAAALGVTFKDAGEPWE